MESLPLSFLVLNKWLVALTVFLAFLAGTAAAYWGIRRWKLTNASKSWPITYGKVVSARVYQKPFSRRPAAFGTAGSGYLPEVTYEYSVDGVAYSGGMISFQLGSRYLPKQRANEILSRYPEGKTVLVHFDPGNPKLAVLEPGGSKLPLLGVLTVGILFLVVALFFSFLVLDD